MCGHVSRIVVIEVAALGTPLELSVQCCIVYRERYVEHRDFVSGIGVEASDEIDITLGSGDEHALARFHQAQLMKRADSIRVAVENIIKYSHGFRQVQARC